MGFRKIVLNSFRVIFIAPILILIIYFLWVAYLKLDYIIESKKPRAEYYEIINTVAPLLNNENRKYYFGTPYEKYERDGSVMRAVYVIPKNKTLKEIIFLDQSRRVSLWQDKDLLQSVHASSMEMIPFEIKNKKLLKVESLTGFSNSTQLKAWLSYYIGKNNYLYIEILAK